MSLEQTLIDSGVFKGEQGMRGLLESQEFWDKQPYCTRLYYGDGVQDYLHRSVLRTAVERFDRLTTELDRLTTELAAVKAERDAMKVDAERLELLFQFAQKKLGDKVEALADALIKANNMTEFRAAIDAAISKGETK